MAREPLTVEQIETVLYSGECVARRVALELLQARSKMFRMQRRLEAIAEALRGIDLLAREADGND